MDFPGGSVIQNLPVMQERRFDAGRSPGEGNGNPLHSPCLGNPVDRGASQTTVYVVAKSQTQLNHQHQRHNLRYIVVILFFVSCTGSRYKIYTVPLRLC